jgi:hypothetical protein
MGKELREEFMKWLMVCITLETVGRWMLQAERVVQGVTP